MKSLEQNKVSKFESFKNTSVFYTTTSTTVEENPDDSISLSESFDYDPLADEEQPLIKKTPVLRRRNSFKKLPTKKKHKMSAIISFFRKN